MPVSQDINITPQTHERDLGYTEEGLLETDTTYVNDQGNTEKEMTEIITELKKLDPSQLVSVLDTIKGMRHSSKAGQNPGRYS